MPLVKTARERKRIIDSAYGSSTFYGILLSDQLSSVDVMADPTADTFTAAGNDFVNGLRVKASNLGGGLPNGTDTVTTYRVIQKLGANFKLCLESTYDKASRTGTPIDITSTGSGTHTLTEQAFDPNLDNDLDVYIRKEANYYGSSRQGFSNPPASLDTPSKTALQTVTFTPTIGTPPAITYRYFAVIAGGSGTPGDTTGTLVGVEDYGSTQTITDSGSQFKFEVVF